MPAITLSRVQALDLLNFCKKHSKDRFFIAKDSGAYLGASVGSTPDKQCLFYFRGCDPKKDADYYENARYAFGGDDFGEFLPVGWLEKFNENPKIAKIKVTVNKRSIKAEYALG